MSGPYGEQPRRPHPNDPRAQFPPPPQPPRRPAPPPPRGGEEEPWWRNVNREPGAPRSPYRGPQAPLPASLPPPISQRPPPRPPPPPPPAPAPRRNRGTRAVWIAAGIVVVLAGGVALGVGLAGLNPVRDNVLDVAQVEDDVTAVLRDPVDGYGVTGLTDITCNDGKNPEVTAGREFHCEVVVNDRTRSVLAVFQDDAGTYAVDRPR